jgi:hypothetical protein
LPKAAIEAAWVYAIDLACELPLFTIFYPLSINTHSAQIRLRQDFQRSERRQSREKTPMLRSKTVALKQSRALKMCREK